MRPDSELLHVSRVEDAPGQITTASLARLAPEFRRAAEVSECRMGAEGCCRAPRERDDCEWGPTVFCAARLREAVKVSEAYDANVERKERYERAEVCAIPRWSYDLLGVHTGKECMRETDAVRLVRGFLREKVLSDGTRVFRQRDPLIVLSGQDGAGKSTAAALWCYRAAGWYYLGTKIQWWTPKGGWRPDPEDARLVYAPAVAIVGIDKWATKEGAHRRNLVHILHERVNAGRSTLITTTLTGQDLDLVLGSGLMRKINRWGGLARISETVDGTRNEQVETTF